MDKFITRVPGGVSVRLHSNGEHLTVHPGKSVVLENFVGAHVTLSATDSCIHCEAKAPESIAPFTATFDLDDKELEPNIETLEAHIGQIRVAMNGRW